MLKSFKVVLLSVVLFMLSVVPVQAREVIGKIIPDGEDYYPILEIVPSNTFTVKDTKVINGSTYVNAKEFATKAGYSYLVLSDKAMQFTLPGLGIISGVDTNLSFNIADFGSLYRFNDFDSSFFGHTYIDNSGGVELEIAKTAIPVKKNGQFYINAKDASRMLNNDYNCLPTFNADKTVTFTSNVNLIVKCVGYVYSTYTLDGCRIDTVNRKEFYF